MRCDNFCKKLKTLLLVVDLAHLLLQKVWRHSAAALKPSQSGSDLPPSKRNQSVSQLQIFSLALQPLTFWQVKPARGSNPQTFSYPPSLIDFGAPVNFYFRRHRNKIGSGQLFSDRIGIRRSRESGQRWESLFLKKFTDQPNFFGPEISGGSGHTLTNNFAVWHRSQQDLS